MRLSQRPLGARQVQVSRPFPPFIASSKRTLLRTIDGCVLSYMSVCLFQCRVTLLRVGKRQGGVHRKGDRRRVPRFCPERGGRPSTSAAPAKPHNSLPYKLSTSRYKASLFGPALSGSAWRSRTLWVLKVDSRALLGRWSRQGPLDVHGWTWQDVLRMSIRDLWVMSNVMLSRGGKTDLEVDI